jgi:sugar O-acyltransferase (sialic acid O-acetyltransferase NeuD family)
MKNLIIIGAGGFGREVFIWARDNAACGRDWQVRGYLDNRPGVLDGYEKDANKLPGAVPAAPDFRDIYRRDVPILGDPLTYVPKPDDVFLCALGNPAERRKYATPILQKGGKFIYLQHPKAAVSVFARLGAGCIIGPFTSISPDVSIGDFVTVNSYTSIGHDVDVGDWCEIDGHCLIAGRVDIGSEARIHAGAIITPDTEIGDRAIVGAGAVVLGNVPAGVTVFGNPAKKLNWKKQA